MRTNTFEEDSWHKRGCRANTSTWGLWTHVSCPVHVPLWYSSITTSLRTIARKAVGKSSLAHLHIERLPQQWQISRLLCILHVACCKLSKSAVSTTECLQDARHKAVLRFLQQYQVSCQNLQLHHKIYMSVVGCYSNSFWTCRSLWSAAAAMHVDQKLVLADCVRKRS